MFVHVVGDYRKFHRVVLELVPVSMDMSLLPNLSYEKICTLRLCDYVCTWQAFQYFMTMHIVNQLVN